MDATANVYHATFSNYADSIIKHGLHPGLLGNWLRGLSDTRYCEPGHVYVFESRIDAIYWAGFMDWEFHQTTGSGKISIVCIDTYLRTWEDDVADPLRRSASNGRWLKRRIPVCPRNIVSVETLTRELIRNFVTKTREANSPELASR